MSKKTKSQAKLRMIDLVKTTKDNDFYMFAIEGDFANAEAFVHRMRVELSRMRAQVKIRGFVPRPFKIMLIELLEDESKETRKTKIRLQRVPEGGTRVSEDIDNIFSEIAGGEIIQ